jgi:hypothetical protein
MRRYSPVVSYLSVSDTPRRNVAYGSAVSRIFTVLCVLACALALAPPAHADDSAAPVRVLLTGDSVTHGRHGDYTWRYRLAKELQRQSVAFNFVGSTSTPYQDPGFPTSTYADPNFDHDHFAKAGWKLSEMVGQIGAEVSAQQPDVVVLEAGVNDLLKGSNADALEQALRSWIVAARSGKSDVRIVLSPVLAEVKADADTVNAAAADYDSRLAGVATDLGTADSPITVADTTRGWTPSTTNTWDGLHPTPTGETFIAQRIAEEFQRVGILPGAPSIYRSTPWLHTERPTVKVAGTRATITWSRQVVSGARIQLQRIGGATTSPATIYPSGTASAVVVRGASYDVRVQLHRGSMTGPWGPAVRIRVPVAAVKRPSAPARVTVGRAKVTWSTVAGARSYVVKIRKVHQKRWITRRTAVTHLAVARVAVAKVQAVNAYGHSAWRRDAR